MPDGLPAMGTRNREGRLAMARKRDKEKEPEMEQAQVTGPSAPDKGAMQEAGTVKTTNSAETNTNGKTNAAQQAPSTDATSQTGQTQAETQRPLDKISAVGHAVWLMTQSPLHKHLFITDMEWLLLPPVAAGQFRLWRKDNLPLAFASWAFLNEETEQRMIAGQNRLAPGAWKSGDRLWLMDLIAPFGGKEEVLKELKEQVFPGRTIKSLQPDAEGKMRVMEF